MTIKPVLALCLALGLAGCVDEADPVPGDPQTDQDEIGPDTDPPGTAVPDGSDGTCGSQRGNQLKADGPCTPAR